MSIIFGIDPGSLKLGIAIMDVCLDQSTVHAIETRTITPVHTYQGTQYTDTPLAKLSADERIELISAEIRYLLEIHEPILVCFETAFYSRRFPTAFPVLQKQLNNLMDTVKTTAPYADIQAYSPPTAKKAVGAAVRGGKDAVRVALKDKGLSLLISDYDNISEHAVDAVAIGYCGLIKYII